jgi:hypothetical protein
VIADVGSSIFVGGISLAMLKFEGSLQNVTHRAKLGMCSTHRRVSPTLRLTTRGARRPDSYHCCGWLGDPSGLQMENHFTNHSEP